MTPYLTRVREAIERAIQQHHDAYAELVPAIESVRNQKELVARIVSALTPLLSERQGADLQKIAYDLRTSNRMVEETGSGEQQGADQWKHATLHVACLAEDPGFATRTSDEQNRIRDRVIAKNNAPAPDSPKPAEWMGDDLLTKIMQCAVCIHINIDDEKWSVPKDPLWVPTIRAHATMILEYAAELTRKHATDSPSPPQRAQPAEWIQATGLAVARAWIWGRDRSTTQADFDKAPNVKALADLVTKEIAKHAPAAPSLEDTERLDACLRLNHEMNQRSTGNYYLPETRGGVDSMRLARAARKEGNDK